MMNSEAEREAVFQEFESEGMPVYLVRTTAGAYNTTTGEVTNTTTTYTSNGFITNYRLKDIDGTLIKQGDRRVLLAATADMPDPIGDDTLTIMGESWAVIYCEPVAPVGIPLLYKVQVRKGTG